MKVLLKREMRQSRISMETTKDNTNRNRTVIVFGATGNLGAYTSLYLKDCGYNVIAVGRRKSDNGFFVTKGIDYYSIDIKNKNNFSILPIENIYAIVHFASTLPSRYDYDPEELFESITIGTLHLLDWMRTISCGKIIFAQTPSDMVRYHNRHVLIPQDAPREFPLTGDHAVYTIAKNAAVDLLEHYRAQYGIRFFALRSFTIYQYHPNPYHYADFKRRMMPYRMLMNRAMQSLPIEIWGNCKKAKEIVYIKDYIRLVECCVRSECLGGCYNVGNGWQVSLEEQIKGIIEVFSPKENPSKIVYCPDKPDPLENAFDITKTFSELNYRPIYSYLDQLRDMKNEMETEPFAQLWGTKEDYKI